MTIKPFNNIGEVRALIGTGRRVKCHSRDTPPQGDDNLTILAIGVTSIFVSNEDGREFTIGRYNILNYYGVEVPDEYVYVNVYRKDGRLIGGLVSNSRKEADLYALSARVGCLKINLEERFDD